MADTVDDTLPASIAPAVAPRDVDIDLDVADPGRYSDRKVIAKGGMGKIVTAYDRKLGRTVAIKELRDAQPELSARFEREIRLTARLEHPSIVAIHEAGRWPSGELFYAMRLVPGRSLQEVIAQTSTLAGRLALVPHVIAIADALAYAHDRHVIHRDLKPANVMIGEFGETLVIDWGLAKEIDHRSSASSITTRNDGGATELGAVLGTPAYMPPEQAEGRSTDERSDVYAIGAILYHVLAGRPPYDGSTTTELLASVRGGPPPPLDAAGIAPDLLAIVARAMARTIDDRYPTAKQLADDLRAFQAGRLVGAHRYTTRERFVRWGRRHRAALAVAGAAVLALVGIGVASIVRIVDARRLAEEQRVVAENQRASAEHNRAQAEELLDFILGDLRAKLSPVGQLDLLAAAMGKAGEYYAGREQATTHAEWSRLAELHSGLAMIKLLEGDHRSAIAEARATLAALAKLPAGDPHSVIRADEAHSRIADALLALGERDEALAEDRVAVAEVAAAAARHRDNAEIAALVGLAHARLGEQLAQRGEIEAARSEYRLNLASQEQLVARSPSVPARRDLAAAHELLGNLASIEGNLDAAEVEYRAMLESALGVADGGPGSVMVDDLLAGAHTHLGEVHDARGNNKLALAEYLAAFDRYERIAARNPDDLRTRLELVRSEFSLADAMHRTADPHASQHFQHAVDVATATAVQHPDDVGWQDTRAYALTFRGVAASVENPTAAVADLRGALAIREKLAEADPTQVRPFEREQVRVRLGEALLAAGDRAGARQQLETARDTLDGLLRDNPAMGMYKGDADEARAALARMGR